MRRERKEKLLKKEQLRKRRKKETSLPLQYYRDRLKKEQTRNMLRQNEPENEKEPKDYNITGVQERLLATQQDWISELGEEFKPKQLSGSKQPEFRKNQKW